MGISKSKNNNKQQFESKTTIETPFRKQRGHSMSYTESRSSEAIENSAMKTNLIGGGNVDAMDDVSWGKVEFSDSEDESYSVEFSDNDLDEMSESVEFSENECEEDMKEDAMKCIIARDMKQDARKCVISLPAQIFGADEYARRFVQNRYMAAIQRRERRGALKREQDKAKTMEHLFVGDRVCIGDSMLGYGSYGEILSVDYDTRACVVLDSGKRVYADIMDLQFVRVYE